MIHFTDISRLFLLLPWAVVMAIVMGSQLRSLQFLKTHTDSRFLTTLTRSTPAALRLHVLLLAAMGALLIVSASGPWVLGTVEASGKDSTVILIIDGSLSMGATDAAPHPVSGEDLGSRFDQARTLCLDLVNLAPEITYGLISFSGSAVIHSPPTRDIHALKTLLKTVRYHYYSQSMGSRFSAAFDAVIHMTADSRQSFQVVLLSDGELSEPDDFSDGLNILARAGIPVHTVAVGSRTWQKMSVFVLEDVLAGLEEKRIAAEYRTRRDDSTLKKMSKKTGGRSFVAEDLEWADSLLEALRSSPNHSRRTADAQHKDLSIYPLVLFLICLVIEWLALAPRPAIPDRTNLPWRRPGVVVLMIIIAATASSGCNLPLLRANAANKKGLKAQRAEEHPSAIIHFERSAAWHMKEHIPTYNRGNSLLNLGDVSSAHEAYQRAIVLEPRSAEAFFNDGHTLYRWGEMALDPQGCDLDQTKELWQQAIGRFASSADLRGPGSKIGIASADNIQAIESRISQLEVLADRCPDSSDDPQADEESDDPNPQADSDENDEPDPSAPGPPGANSGEPDPEEGSGQASSGSELTPEEQDQISGELQRIKAQAEGATTFRQTGEMQLDPATAAGADGRKIKW